MEFFAKIVKNFNYFFKALYFRSLLGSPNQYSLTCEVTLRYILYDTYSDLCLLL